MDNYFGHFLFSDLNCLAAPVSSTTDERLKWEDFSLRLYILVDLIPPLLEDCRRCPSLLWVAKPETQQMAPNYVSNLAATDDGVMAK
jgi:hypothetical protein